MTEAGFAPAPLPSAVPGLDEGASVIGRSAEADRVCAFISKATTRLLVLSGEASSGKTMLVKRWLLPALEASMGAEGYRILYAPCAPGFPDGVALGDGEQRIEDLLARKSVIIVDEFDRVLDMARDERRVTLDLLFSRLHNASRESVVVVVVSARNLTSVYGLSSYDPGIVNAVCILKSIGLSDGLTRPGSGHADASVTYTPAVLSALEEEVKQRGIDVSFDLLQLIHTRAQRFLRDTGKRVIDTEQYTAVGGLTGMLRGHLEQHLEELEAERRGSGRIARAILHRILEAQARGAAVDLRDIGPRFDAPDVDVQAVLVRLTESGGLLAEIRSDAGHYQFRPAQIATLVEADRASRQVLNERGQRIVEEGLRGWQLLGTYLPPARFAEIHRQRAHLVLDPDLVRFLLQCALRHENAELAGASSYWFHRLSSHDDGVDVLLAALFDQAADVRSRAATLLGICPDELVRERLCVLALTDDAPAVRAAAIASLAHMADEALLARLRREVENPQSPTREHAIGALQIFPRPDVSLLLQQLVAEPTTQQPIRAKAVSILAALSIRESVDALVDIALTDQDAEDREAAGKALALTPTPELNRHILARLSWPRPIARMVATATVLAIVCIAGTGLVYGAMGVSVLAGGEAVVGALFVGMIVLAVVTRVLLGRVASGKIPRRSPLGILAFASFAVCSVTILPWVHGLAHMMIGRARRGVALLSLEALGVVLIVLSQVTDSVPWLAPLTYAYQASGVLLIVGSYLYDVLAVALGTFLLRDTTTREARRSAIYREVFRNPAMDETVFDDLRSAVADEARRAARRIRRFGAFMLPRTLVERFAASDPADRPYVTRALAKAKDYDAVARLEALWPAAPREQRRRITTVLTKKPTARCVEALERLKPGAGPLFAFRAVIARLQFRLNVWPRAAQLTVLAVIPAALVLAYHGAMIRSNPAWGEISVLRRSRPFTSDDRKVKIVAFLIDAYPRDAAVEFTRLFREGQRREVDTIHAAITRGLVDIADSAQRKGDDELATTMRGVPDELATALPRFDSLLNDPVKFDLGIWVLAKMASASDSTLADSAVKSLVKFALSNAPDTGSMTMHKARTIDELSRIPYTRALPALDDVLNGQVTGKVQSKTDGVGINADRVRNQIEQVAWKAYASIPDDPKGAKKRVQLLSLLQSRAPDLTELIALVKQDSARDKQRCDQNGDRQCVGKGDALRLIAGRPFAEAGYRDLLQHFTTDKEYTAAASEFARLVAQYPTSVWPRKILAEIEHEYVSASDDKAFERSYTYMSALRNIDAYRKLRTENPQDFTRSEADFAEVALSARHYDTTTIVAQRILDGKPTDVDRYNMALFPYIASVVAKDSGAARARLEALAAAVSSLPDGYYNNWVYPGTLVFIEGTDLPGELKGALRKLCREGAWFKGKDAASAIIQANRVALDHFSWR